MNDESETRPQISMAVCFFAIFWIVLGMIAFVRSLVCFGYSGSTTEKVVGLLIAWFAGPFYLLYRPAGYCTM